MDECKMKIKPPDEIFRDFTTSNADIIKDILLGRPNDLREHIFLKFSLKVKLNMNLSHKVYTYVSLLL